MPSIDSTIAGILTDPELCNFVIKFMHRHVFKTGIGNVIAFDVKRTINWDDYILFAENWVFNKCVIQFKACFVIFLKVCDCTMTVDQVIQRQLDRFCEFCR